MNKTDKDAQLEHYSTLIGLIYAVAASPDRWPQLMQVLEQHFLHHATDQQQARLLEPHFAQAIQLDRKNAHLHNRNQLFDGLINYLPLGR